MLKIVTIFLFIGEVFQTDGYHIAPSSPASDMLQKLVAHVALCSFTTNVSRRASLVTSACCVSSCAQRQSLLVEMAVEMTSITVKCTDSVYLSRSMLKHPTIDRLCCNNSK